MLGSMPGTHALLHESKDVDGTRNLIEGRKSGKPDLR